MIYIEEKNIIQFSPIMKDRFDVVDLKKLGYTEEQVERIKIIGEAIKRIDEKQGLEKIRIYYDSTIAQITTSSLSLEFDKIRSEDWSDWQEIMDAATNIDLGVDIRTDPTEPLLQITIVVHKFHHIEDI